MRATTGAPTSICASGTATARGPTRRRGCCYRKRSAACFRTWISPRAHVRATPADIAALPLLHVEWVDPDWTDWTEFLSRAGIPHGASPGRRFNNFAVTLQATEEDQGIALGWHHLVASRIEAGKLVRFTDLSMPAPGSYYLTWNDNRELSAAAVTLRDWLIETAAAGPV